MPKKEQLERRLQLCEEAYTQSRSVAALLEALDVAASLGSAPPWLATAARDILRDTLISPLGPAKDTRGPASPLSRLKGDLRRLYRAGIADSARANLGLTWKDARDFAAWYLSTPEDKVCESTIRHDIEEVRRWHREEPGRARLFAVARPGLPEPGPVAQLIPRVEAPHSASAWLAEHHPRRRDRVGAEWRPLTPFVMGWALPEIDPK